MTDASVGPEIGQRLVLLERALRRARWQIRFLFVALVMTFIFGPFALALVMTGRVPANWLQVRGLSLVNGAGVETARLSNGREGPLLMLRAKALDSDVFLGAFPANVGLFVQVHDTPRISLMSGSKDAIGPDLSISGKDGHVVVGVSNNDDNPHVLLSGADHHTHLYMSIGKEPGIRATDSAGKDTIRLPASDPEVASPPR